MNYLEITHFPELDYISAEGMNSLITNISYCGPNIRTIMITSRYSSEGKSYVSMNLMRSMAALGRRVVVVDADLRASGIQMDYSLRTATGTLLGLSDYLSGHCKLENALYQTNIPNAWMIPAGHEAPNPLQLLDTDTMKQLMEGLASNFDVVLVDTPPVGILVDGVALAKHCDGALLVVAYRHGKQREIGDVVESIKQTGCRVLGAVMNEVRFKNLSNKHYYYNSKRYATYYRKRHARKRQDKAK